jgi:ABC-type glycerol-3-phosphate transport system substrate-binding protein
MGQVQDAMLKRHDYRVPGTNVIVDPQWGIGGDAVTLAWAAGAPYDVSWHRYQQSTIDAIHEGLIVCAEEMLEADGISLDIYSDGPREAYTFEGKMWALPWEVVIHMWTYDAKMFREAEVEPPDKNWTWDDIVEIGLKMTRDTAGKHPDEAGFDINEVDVWGLGPWFYFGGEEHYPRIAGGEYIDETGTKLTITTPPFVETLNWLRDWFQKHRIAVKARPERGLQTGRIAMYETGNWALLGLYKDVPELMGVYPPTHPVAGKMSTVLPDKELWVPKQEDTTRVEAAWKFAKWWGLDMYLEFAVLTGYAPYLKRDMEDPRWTSLVEDKPFLKVAEEMVQYGHARFWKLFPGAFEAWPVMHEMWDAIEATDIPAEKLLADAQAECQRILDKHRK